MAERNTQELPDLDVLTQFDRHFIGEEPVERKVYGDLYVQDLLARFKILELACTLVLGNLERLL